MDKSPVIINEQYVIISKIGIGGFATVYKGWDIMLQKFVAIKKIHEKYASDAKYVDMFRGEAVNTAKLEHGNIVRVINFINDQAGNYYIVMDFVKGLDLEVLIKKCQQTQSSIPLNCALYIIAEMIKALDYAHNVNDEITGHPLNIIHQDVSPGNFMLYFDGRIKLTDFGIAKAGEHEIKPSERFKLKGKISYMSPEQAAGDVSIDNRSDLFGCGAILFEILTGIKAFAGKDDVETWNNVRNVNLDLKQLQQCKVPEEIIVILRKMLQKSPEDRYRNAVDIFIDLKKYLSRQGTTEQLQAEYKNFISSVFAEEIAAMEAAMAHDSNLDFVTMVNHNKVSDAPDISQADTMAKTSASKNSALVAQLERHLEEKDRESEKKASFPVFIVVFGILLLLIIDVFTQFTFIGAGIYNSLWPPILKIDTVPKMASVELIDKEGIDIVAKRGMGSISPVYIADLKPGVYTLRLEKQRFGVIVKKITVFGKGRGSKTISIPDAELIDDIHIINFEIAVAINSIPQGAELYVDGRKVGNTPFLGTLNVGQHNIYLVKDDYSMLGSMSPDTGFVQGICVLDTSQTEAGQEMIDADYWRLNLSFMEDGKRKMILIGKMESMIPANSGPQVLSGLEE